MSTTFSCNIYYNMFMNNKNYRRYYILKTLQSGVKDIFNFIQYREYYIQYKIKYLKSLWGLSFFSNDFSRLPFNHLINRWQFINISHQPLWALVSTIQVASASMPQPKEKYLNLLPLMPTSSAKLATSERGSAPGDKMKTIGDFSDDYWNIFMQFMLGAFTK